MSYKSRLMAIEQVISDLEIMHAITPDDLDELRRRYDEQIFRHEVENRVRGINRKLLACAPENLTISIKDEEMDGATLEALKLFEAAGWEIDYLSVSSIMQSSQAIRFRRAAK